MTPLLSADDLFLRFGPTPVLSGVSVGIQPGEVHALLGPSGSGKSTLLRTINHLEAQDAGRIQDLDQRGQIRRAAWALAAELGYADHAHLTNDFRAVLNVTPRAYRSARG